MILFTGIQISPSPIKQQKSPCKTYIELFMKIYINDLHRQLIYGVKKHIGNQTDMKVPVKIYHCILLNQRKM